MVTNIITAFVTAYIATGHPCANGKMPSINYTVAIPRSMPLGCDVFIEGKKYKGEDRTAWRYDGRFDIFMATKKQALLWGKKRLVVTVVSTK